MTRQNEETAVLATPEGEQRLSEVKHSLDVTREESLGGSERMAYKRWYASAKSYFFKEAKTEELYRQIQAQVTGARALGRLINGDLISTEKVVAYGYDWILTEWVDGGPMLHSNTIEDLQDPGRIAEFAKVLAFVDKQAITPDLKGKELCYGSNTPSSRFVERTREKCQVLVQKGVDEHLIKEVIARIDSATPQLMPAWQHGDLNPWHILKGKDTWVAIDCEHVHDNWPRYYDIANAYSQFCIRFNRGDLAELLVDNFQSLTGTKVTQAIEFRAMVLMRNLGRAIEYQDDPKLLARALKQTKIWKNKV